MPPETRLTKERKAHVMACFDRALEAEHMVFPSAAGPDNYGSHSEDAPRDGSAFAIVLVDPSPGVEGEALKKGAAASVGKRVGISEAPVHRGGLERGQRVVLELLVVGSEGLGRPPDDAPEDGLHILMLRRGQRYEVRALLLAKTRRSSDALERAVEATEAILRAAGRGRQH